MKIYLVCFEDNFNRNVQQIFKTRQHAEDFINGEAKRRAQVIMQQYKIEELELES